MQIDAGIMERIAAGDRHAYIDFFKDFNTKYEESVEKIFSMMGMGANRESNEDLMKVMNAYIKMLFTAGELSVLISDSIRDSAKVLVDRYQQNIKEGKVVTTFRDFYNLWYSVTEEVLLGLLNTDDFSKVFGDFSDKYAQYMIALNKVQERMLASLPIPTNSDMNSLYRTVYDLRKAVRDLTREIEGMKGKKGDK
jgi:class III poly(R)-hydroxyalkanoic acid synthase PhaE subunit